MGKLVKGNSIKNKSYEEQKSPFFVKEFDELHDSHIYGSISMTVYIGHESSVMTTIFPLTSTSLIFYKQI